MTIGEKVQQLRAQRGLTLKGLEEESGVHESIIHRLETGKRPNPYLWTVKALAQALGTSIDYLAGMYERTGEGLAPERYQTRRKRKASEKS